MFRTHLSTLISSIMQNSGDAWRMSITQTLLNKISITYSNKSKSQAKTDQNIMNFFI